MGARPEPSISVAPRMTIVMSCNMGHRLTRGGISKPRKIFKILNEIS